MALLDLRTLLLVMVLASLGCAALSAALSRINNRRGTLSALAWAEGCLGTGFALIAARTAMPDLLSYVVANLLIVAGYGGQWLAVRRLVGLRFPWPIALAVLTGVGGIQTWLTFVEPSLPGRIMLISAVCLCSSVLVIRDCLQYRVAVRVLILPHAIFAAMMGVRVWLAWVMPDPAAQPLLSTGAVQQIFFLGVLLLQLWMAQTMLWCVGMEWYREVAGAVSARQHAEQRHYTSETRLTALMTMETACIAFLDPQGRIVEASAALCRLLGASSSRDLQGDSLLSYTVDADRERVALLHRALNEGQIGSYHVRKSLQSRRGGTVRADVTVGPLPGGPGTGFVVFCHPLTDMMSPVDMAPSHEGPSG